MLKVYEVFRDGVSQSFFEALSAGDAKSAYAACFGVSLDDFLRLSGSRLTTKLLPSVCD